MSDAMDSDVREVIRRRIALRERDGHERLLLNHEALRALLDAADERDRLASALVRAQGPFACCSHCEGDAIHDVETSAHEVPCTLCQSSVGEVERLRDVRDQLAAAAERVRALHERDGEGFCAACDYMTPHPCPTPPRAGDQAMKPPISDDLVERCARAAYVAVMAGAPPSRATWDERPEPFREQDRLRARAVLTEALRPAPDPPVLDGQDPLI